MQVLMKRQNYSKEKKSHATAGATAAIMATTQVEQELMRLPFPHPWDAVLYCILVACMLNQQAKSTGLLVVNRLTGQCTIVYLSV